MAVPSRPPRLPPGAQWGFDDALATVGAPQLLGEAFQYWSGQFRQLDVDPFATDGGPALALARRLSNDELRRAPAADFHAERAIQGIGCMLSTREIAEHIARISPAGPPFTVTPEAVFEHLRVFRAAAVARSPVVGDAERAAAARGLIAAREIFDVARRYAYCARKDGPLSTAETLALFRQEGGFGLTPPADSLPHGSLIMTGSGCRSDRVLFDQGESRAARPGYNLVFQRRAHVAPSPLGLAIEAARTNLVVVGGLDSVANPKSPPEDELLQVFRDLVDAPSGAPSTEVRDAMGRRLRGLERLQILQVIALMSGLAMVELDETERAPTVAELLGHAWLEASGLFDAHPCDESRPPGDVFLSNRTSDDTTRLCLRIQTRWYASRRRLVTLLPRPDRHPVEPPLPDLSPFLGYLRFHSGDAIFVGILLRCLARMSSLENSRSVGAGFRSAMAEARGGWESSARARWPRHLELLGRYERVWSRSVTSTVSLETAWRHVGLIRELKSGSAPPPWLKDPSSGDTLADVGRIATQVLTTIHQFGLLPALERLLFETRISVLFRLVPTLSEKWKSVFAKAHTFEALRSGYAEALAAS